jgi:hypothetical protein
MNTRLPDTRYDLMQALSDKLILLELAMLPLRRDLRDCGIEDDEKEGTAESLELIEAQHENFTAAWNLLNALESWYPDIEAHRAQQRKRP